MMLVSGREKPPLATKYNNAAFNARGVSISINPRLVTDSDNY